MSTSPNDPFVDMRRSFPLGPVAPGTVPAHVNGVVPFGVRYAVPSVVNAASGNEPTKPKVSINAPTSPDGKPGQPTQVDDVITEGSD